MQRLAAFLALLLLTQPAWSRLKPVGAGELELFDPGRKAWRPQGALVLYQAEPELLQVHLPAWTPAGPLIGRLQLEKLPHYRRWVEAQQARGGLAWKALSALLEEVQGRPVRFLSLGPFPSQGRAEIRIGLMDGTRFKPYGRALGTVASSRRGLVFEAESLVLENASAKAAWTLMAPLARHQLSRIAGQR